MLRREFLISAATAAVASRPVFGAALITGVGEQPGRKPV